MVGLVVLPVIVLAEKVSVIKVSKMSLELKNSSQPFLNQPKLIVELTFRCFKARS